MPIQWGIDPALIRAGLWFKVLLFVAELQLYLLAYLANITETTQAMVVATHCGKNTCRLSANEDSNESP